MAYVVPQVKVFQEFTQTPAAITNPLRAFVFGPNFDVKKFSDNEGLLGQYDSSADTAFAWPDRPAGAVVDQDYTKVWIKDALLRYYSNSSGLATDEIAGVVNRNNRIRAEDVNFKANGVLWPLDTALNDRDVAVGDVARVWSNVGGTTYELWTSVLGFAADQAAASIAATATADTDNSGSLNISVTGADAAANTCTRVALGAECNAAY